MAQPVQCPASFDWANNAKGDGPCAVASQLLKPCDSGAPAFSALAPGGQYSRPTPHEQSSCLCSNVVYALVSACADCQSGEFSNWQDWSADCDPLFQGGYPKSVPEGTLIPPWANINVSAQPSYDRSIEQAIAKQQTSSSPALSSSDQASSAVLTSTSFVIVAISQTSTAVTQMSTQKASYLVDSTSASIAGVSLPTSTGSSTSPSGSTKDKGVLAGGITGALVFGALAGAFLYWWLMRRRRARTAPSAAYIASYGQTRPPTNMSHRALGDGSATETPLFSQSRSNSDFYDRDNVGLQPQSYPGDERGNNFGRSMIH